MTQAVWIASAIVALAAWAWALVPVLRPSAAERAEEARHQADTDALREIAARIGEQL